MNRIILLTVLAFASLNLSAQLEFDGLWEGTLTFGQTMKGHHMALYLEKSGTKVTGRAYIHVSKDRIVETEISGTMYQDFSVYLDDIRFVNTQNDEYIPPYLRKFQLLWKRSIGGGGLQGHWQENRKEVFHEERKRGMVYLRKVNNYKA